MEKLSKLLTWQMVAVLLAGGCVFLLITFFAPPDAREELIGANGLLWSLVAYYLRSPRGGPPPPPPAVMLALALALSGCGASAVQQHTTAIRVTATVLDGAADLAETAVTAELVACRDLPCTHDVEARWAPVEAASAAVILAMQGWVVALDMVRATGADGAPGAVWRVALRAAESLGVAWGRLVDSARAVGVALPELPPIVTQAASLIGGV